MIVDLCRENLTQRDNEFRMELDAVLLSKKYLEGKLAGVRNLDTRDKSGRINKAAVSQGIGTRQIANFLSKEGKAISHEKVSELLRIYEALDPIILSKVKKFDGKRKFQAGRKGNSLLSQFFLPLRFKPGL